MEYFYWIFLGISPAFFCLWYLYRKDKWEPEPKWQVFKIFAIGVIAIVPAAILEEFVQHVILNDITYDDMMGITSTALILNFTVCFLAIAPVEEFFKYSVVKVFIYHREDFNEKVDGVVYMVAAAMGFSAFENVMYIFQAGFHAVDTSPTTVGLVRGALATPAHAIFSGFLGVYLGRAKFSGNVLYACGLTLQGLFIAIFLHGLYNVLVFMSSGAAWGGAAVGVLLLGSGWVLMKKVKRLVDESPFKPENAQQASK